MTELRSEVADLLSEATLRYSMVWEDSALLTEGLALTDEDDVLCICSAGDNVLALALAGARSVTAVDMNPAQSALLELKLAAAERLDYSGFLQLLGLADGDAVARYRSIREDLNELARAFWDEHEDTLAEGVCFAGRLEKYILGFAREHLGDLWPADLFDKLVAADSVQKQAALYESEARTAAFEERFRWYFGREMMAKHGRDPAQFRHVQDGDVGGYFLRRFSWAMTRTRLEDNFYVRAFLSGDYGLPAAGPDYLLPQNYDRLREVAPRVRVVTGQMEQVLAQHGPFDKGAFSDMFEYMSEDLAADVLGGLADAFAPGGRLAWWCLLVPRPVPEAVRPRLAPLKDLGERLWAQDRSWFYRSFQVAKVRSVATEPTGL